MEEEHYYTGAVILPTLVAAVVVVAIMIAIPSFFETSSSLTSSQGAASSSWSHTASNVGDSSLGASYTEDDDGIDDSLVALGILLFFLVPFLGRLLALCSKPQKLRALYGSRLESPG